MNDWTLRTMRQIYEEASAGIVIEDGLVRYDRPGHTRQIAHLPVCHEGRYSAGYYALETLLESKNMLEASTGSSGRSAAQRLETLRALERLQITDPEDSHYGAFRWYAEESAVQDSNAAFFILMPLVSLRLRAPGAVPPAHTGAIDGMLRHAASWFERECREPELYYPNKTMSDGAMLLAIASLLGDEARLALSMQYFERWADYTARRGWGWGENMSLVYQSVMLNALEIALPLLQERRPELAERLEGHRRTLLDILLFHDGHEFVPTIRSYNFGGEVRRSSLAWLIAGVTGTDELEHKEASRGADGPAPLQLPFQANDFPTLLLFEGDFQAQGTRHAAGVEARMAAAGGSAAGDLGGATEGFAGTPEAERLPVPRIRREKVFDDTYAYSWIGRRTRLGSLNAFPVIPGSYQHESWGLGWQSFPLSAAAEDGQVSYARWFVDDGHTIRTHPAESYKTAYLMPALFRQRPYPQVRTYAAQSEYALLAIRTLENVRQPAAEIADEWIVHRFEGRPIEVVGGGGRLWQVLRYPGAAIAIAPLLGIRFDAAELGEAEGAEEDMPACAALPDLELGLAEHRAGLWVCASGEEGVKLRQVLYAGQARTLSAPKLESGWAVLCLDEAADEAAVRARLEAVVIEDEAVDDRETPRDPHERIRLVRLLESGQERVVLRLDPQERE